MHDQLIERGVLHPDSNASHAGCKETEAVWLSANVMVFSNNDIQINEDIAAALDLIPELVRRSKIDQLVDECSTWIKKRHTDFKEGDCIYDKRRMD